MNIPRDLTREAMNIPRDHVNDFLTKIAHGEVIGSHDTVFSSSVDSDSKRRKLSGSGSYTRLSSNGGDTGDTGMILINFLLIIPKKAYPLFRKSSWDPIQNSRADF